MVDLIIFANGHVSIFIEEVKAWGIRVALVQAAKIWSLEVTKSVCRSHLARRTETARVGRIRHISREDK